MTPAELRRWPRCQAEGCYGLAEWWGFQHDTPLDARVLVVCTLHRTPGRGARLTPTHVFPRPSPRKRVTR